MAVYDYRLSRRSLVATAIGASCAVASGANGQKGQMFEAEVERYPDPATEFQVYRLTDPSYTSILPGRYNRLISRNSGTLLHRHGKWQVITWQATKEPAAPAK